MSKKPEDVPEAVQTSANGVWHELVSAENRDAQEAVIARAIMAATAEEREACAVVAKSAHGISRPENDLQIGAVAGGIAAAAAIRKRGEG